MLVIGVVLGIGKIKGGEKMKIVVNITWELDDTIEEIIETIVYLAKKGIWNIKVFNIPN